MKCAVEKDIKTTTAGHDGEWLQTFCYSGYGFRITTIIRGIENGMWTFGHQQYSHVPFTLGPRHHTCSLCNFKVLR